MTVPGNSQIVWVWFIHVFCHFHIHLIFLHFHFHLIFLHFYCLFLRLLMVGAVFEQELRLVHSQFFLILGKKNSTRFWYFSKLDLFSGLRLLSKLIFTRDSTLTSLKHVLVFETTRSRQLNPLSFSAVESSFASVYPFRNTFCSHWVGTSIWIYFGLHWTKC